MIIDYVGVKEINGSLIVIDGVEGVSYEEIVDRLKVMDNCRGERRKENETDDKAAGVGFCAVAEVRGNTSLVCR